METIVLSGVVYTIYKGWFWIVFVAIMAVSMLAGAKEGKEQRQLAEFNAAQAEREAAERKSESEAEAAKIEREGRILRGEQAAQAGGAGLTQTGSVLDVIADEAMEVELKRQEVLRRGRTEERAGTETASLERLRGKKAEKAGILKGASSGASTGASFAGMA